MAYFHIPTIFRLLLLAPIISATKVQEVFSKELGETSLHIHEYWMRHANTLYAELTPSHTPCPFNAFAAVVVNHSLSTPEYPLGKPVCTGVNGVTEWGNPTLHGEMAAINNCSRIFKEQEVGQQNEGLGGGKVWRDLTIYSTAEPCPMVCFCAVVPTFSHFRE
jgi:tRNA(Arg) A34 adenosine deaminase TadA